MGAGYEIRGRFVGLELVKQFFEQLFKPKLMCGLNCPSIKLQVERPVVVHRGQKHTEKAQSVWTFVLDSLAKRVDGQPLRGTGVLTVTSNAEGGSRCKL